AVVHQDAVGTRRQLGGGPAAHLVAARGVNHPLQIVAQLQSVHGPISWVVEVVEAATLYAGGRRNKDGSGGPRTRGDRVAKWCGDIITKDTDRAHGVRTAQRAHGAVQSAGRNLTMMS